MNLLEHYRRRAPAYDLELAAFEPWRQACIDRLQLRPGATVLDVGCGTGLSLPLLQALLGPQGHIIGIEHCPAMMEHARQRVKRHGWRNVELVCAPAAQAELHRQADAALFVFTHDILQQPQTLRHLARALRPGARVAAVGLSWAPAWAVASNCFVLGAALYSVESMQGLDRPWLPLQALCGALEIRHAPWGGIYLADGRLATAPPRRSGHDGQKQEHREQYEMDRSL